MNRPCRSSLPSPLFTACQQQQQQQQTPSRCVPKHSGSPLQGASGDRGSVSNGTSDGAISKPVGSNISVSSSSSSSDTDSGDAAVKKTKTVNRTRRERPVGVRARVLFSFEASGPGELSVTAGQPVRALYHVGKRWLFVLTGAGQVGYIPFLYAAKEAWAPCRPVPSMRRYCREFSPQPAQQPAAADCPGEQRLCLPADLSRPPAMAPEERLPASEESSDSRRGGRDRAACDWSRLGLRCRVLSRRGAAGHRSFNRLLSTGLADLHSTAQ
ncbi:hypothetical protein BOX15_Mlig029396g2 [Macrostomum lignano]|uniref:SH3 domain-containing protein n=1 Tax=Macrostomum lignano TaxID=282301 RepID=A0A267FR00_9PLAT|nr:hypothetical protein BOX15_Mlig029396g2 [Macrostomum lignano]